jgi:hypothetical protein
MHWIEVVVIRACSAERLRRRPGASRGRCDAELAFVSTSCAVASAGWARPTSPGAPIAVAIPARARTSPPVAMTAPPSARLELANMSVVRAIGPLVQTKLIDSRIPYERPCGASSGRSSRNPCRQTAKKKNDVASSASARQRHAASTRSCSPTRRASSTPTPDRRGTASSAPRAERSPACVRQRRRSEPTGREGARGRGRGCRSFACGR